MPLQSRIEHLAAQPLDVLDRAEALAAFEELRDALEEGQVRAASPGDDGTWTPHAWIKQGLLLGFRLGEPTEFEAGTLTFLDKHTYPPRAWRGSDGVRVVPGGSAIRRGAFVARGVVCMPPMYINVGAHVGTDTMVDSHALVGSCAQIGARVHLSAAVQIGGVLEPPGALPVIVEDDAFIGGGCGIYEGCLVRRGAVLAPGVTLTRATRVFDLVHKRVLHAEDGLLEIPAGAVVVPGTRPAGGAFAEAHGLGLYAPIIVKYRDAKTDAATSLETALRE